jgi:hypothetical protein
MARVSYVSYVAHHFSYSYIFILFFSLLLKKL